MVDVVSKIDYHKANVKHKHNCTAVYKKKFYNVRSANLSSFSVVGQKVRATLSKLSNNV